MWRYFHPTKVNPADSFTVTRFYERVTSFTHWGGRGGGWKNVTIRQFDYWNNGMMELWNNGTPIPIANGGIIGWNVEASAEILLQQEKIGKME